jgi:anaerobic ribonucleoside-triphosphate reductase
MHYHDTNRENIALSDEERQPCEVWTRVMGYHRPVASFNIGKRAEHEERQHFTEERSFTDCSENRDR